MSQRVDTRLRLALLAAGGAALLAMYAVAGDESLSRTTRFLVLAALGGLVLVGWPGTGLTQPYEERRPVRSRWGKPPRPDASGVPGTAPQPIRPDVMPVSFALDIRNSLLALGGSIVAGAVLGVLGYAVAGSAAPEEGGFLLYVGLAGALLTTLRAALRVLTAGNAIAVDDQRLTLGPALGYIPPLTIARASTAAFESSNGREPKLAILTTNGRRFEIRTDHLRGSGLPHYLAALWPEVPWRN